MRQFFSISSICFSHCLLSPAGHNESPDSLASAFDNQIPEDVDMFSLLSWENMDLQIPVIDDPQQNIYLQEASMTPTQFLVDSDYDALQSQCGPGENWPSSKIQARDGEQCKGRDSSTLLNPNIFNSIILPPGSDSKPLSIPAIVPEDQIKCPPPYSYNFCCNGKPDGFSGAENFFKIWTQIAGCYLGMVTSIKHPSRIFNVSR